eukprot:4522149-Pyramimonas_sp.AAC.1
MKRTTVAPESEAKHARGGSRIQGAKKDGDKWGAELLVLIAKLVLSGARQLAPLENTVYETYFVEEGDANT